MTFCGIIIREPEPAQYQKTDFHHTDGSLPQGAIQSPISSSFLAIEGNSFSQVISQINRFATGSLLTNRIIPINFSFRNYFTLPRLINSNSPTPIFIKGHVFRH